MRISEGHIIQLSSLMLLLLLSLPARLSSLLLLLLLPLMPPKSSLTGEADGVGGVAFRTPAVPAPGSAAGASHVAGGTRDHRGRTRCPSLSSSLRLDLTPLPRSPPPRSRPPPL